VMSREKHSIAWLVLELKKIEFNFIYLKQLRL
jgi:hypothetical protein